MKLKHLIIDTPKDSSHLATILISVFVPFASAAVGSIVAYYILRHAKKKSYMTKKAGEFFRFSKSMIDKKNETISWKTLMINSKLHSSLLSSDSIKYRYTTIVEEDDTFQIDKITFFLNWLPKIKKCKFTLENKKNGNIRECLIRLEKIISNAIDGGEKADMTVLLSNMITIELDLYIALKGTKNEKIKRRNKTKTTGD